MSQPIDSPELQLLLHLQDTQRETASTMMAQIVELQASLNVMMDLQKLTLVFSKQFEQPELDNYCKSQMDKYRRHCLEVITSPGILASQIWCALPYQYLLCRVDPLGSYFRSVKGRHHSLSSDSC